MNLLHKTKEQRDQENLEKLQRSIDITEMLNSKGWGHVKEIIDKLIERNKSITDIKITSSIDEKSLAHIVIKKKCKYDVYNGLLNLIAKIAKGDKDGQRNDE